MGTTYEKAPQEIVKLVRSVMQEHHAALAYCEVRVDVLMADGGEDKNGIKKPVLKLHGYPCAATVKIVSLKQRALGQGDALITIDQATWDGLDATERKGVIDHELLHLEVAAEGGGVVQVDPDTGAIVGAPKYDDHERPRLKTKLHDWQLGGFRQIAQRYGEKALEVQCVRQCQDSTTGQYFWDFTPQEQRDAA